MDHSHHIKKLEAARTRARERAMVKEYDDRGKAPGKTLADEITAKRMVDWYEKKYDCDWGSDRGRGA